MHSAMPIYLFQNPQTKETKELSFSMNEEKFFVDVDGVEWTRLFLPLNLPSNIAKHTRPKDELQGNGVRYITDKSAHEQGYKNAHEYIDAHNEVQAEHAKKLPKTKKKIID